MTPRDAFELPYLLMEVTLPLAARVAIEKHDSGDSALSVAASRVDLEPFFQRIDEILARAQLTSVRPVSRTELQQWSQSLLKQLPSSELTNFGRAIGLVIQNEKLLELIAALPKDDDLSMREAYLRDLRRTLIANVENFGALPVELRGVPAQLAKVMKMSGDRVSVLRGEVGLIAAVLKGERTRPKLSNEDAFLSTLQASEVGVPFVGMDFTDMALLTASPALEQRITKQQNAYRAIGPQLPALIAEVEERLKRSQLAVPPRPNSFGDWQKWSNAIAHAIGAVTGPEQSAGALAALGRAIGEAMLTLSSLAVVTSLREVDDKNAELIWLQQKFEKSLAADVERLTGMSTFTTLPAAVKPHATSMATLMRLISTQRAGYELAWRRMAEIIATIRSLLV